MATDHSHYAFKHHPETCDPEDFWGQVKRGVGGKAVDEAQIQMIVDAVRTGLDLGGDDELLDLCCGNGALTTRVVGGLKGSLGVDYSEFLIDVANKNFASDRERYRLGDAVEYLKAETEPERFTKVLCYGAFPYFANAVARDMLQGLADRFVNVRRILLGQMPDKARMAAFFKGAERPAGEADDPGGLLGLWRTEDEMVALAASTGWDATIVRMPETFFASHYRYDVILTRA